LLCLFPMAAVARPPAVSAATTCSGQVFSDPGFEDGYSTFSWSTSGNVITNSPGEAPHGGSWYAWLDGYGTTHTDTLSRGTFTVPTGCHATLSYWLHIDTAETSTTTAYDKLTVKLTTSGPAIATYSNLNHNLGYSQKNISLSAGPWTLIYTGTEDSSLQTSFVLDDITLTLS